VSFDPYQLQGRVAIVTGGGQGLGRTYAHLLAEAGAIPVLADINLGNAENVAAEVRKIHQEGVLAVETDVTSADSVQRMVDATVARFGRIDILINNAALFSTIKLKPFEEIPLDEWNLAMNVNVTGAFLCARAVSPVMRKAQWGRIINVSSGVALYGRPNYLHYVTSKSALIGMSRALSRELGKDFITVNTILPGAVLTEVQRETVNEEHMKTMLAGQALPRPAEPQDMAGVVLFLASGASAWVTGQAIAVNGGRNNI
jgi:NAD(P)-dependent dehydrogenase (short-subunit alcohol dehydrogenase family)